MRKVMGIWLVVVSMTLWCGLTPLLAQEETKPGSGDGKAKAERFEMPAHAYRIDFSVNELEDGKKINSRHYSMDLTSGERNQLKIGTRVHRSIACCKTKATSLHCTSIAISAISRLQMNSTARSQSFANSTSTAVPWRAPENP